jgi:hypothetical protein
MRRHLDKRFRQKFKRRLCTAVALLAYLAAAIGFPLPKAAARPAAAGCGQRVCCCGTAAQCKASGCGCGHQSAPPVEKAPPACCAKKPVAKSTCCTPAPAKAPGKDKQAPVRWVPGMAAQKCGGGGVEWISANAALPPIAPFDWQPSWPYCHSILINNDHPFMMAADKTDPPPRLEAV